MGCFSRGQKDEGGRVLPQLIRKASLFSSVAESCSIPNSLTHYGPLPFPGQGLFSSFYSPPITTIVLRIFREAVGRQSSVLGSRVKVQARVLQCPGKKDFDHLFARNSRVTPFIPGLRFLLRRERQV